MEMLFNARNGMDDIEWFGGWKGVGDGQLVWLIGTEFVMELERGSLSLLDIELEFF